MGRIAECIVKDEHAVLPVSAVLEGEYGMEKVALSVPAILGRDGLEKILEIPLGPAERQALDRSAQQMSEAIHGLGMQ